MAPVSTLSTNPISSLAPPLRGGSGGQSEELHPSPLKNAAVFGRADRVSLSPQAREQFRKSASRTDNFFPRQTDAEDAPAQTAASPGGMSAEELKHIRDLQRRDAEVRAHEQAHLAAAGHFAAGGASFTYQMGPNGRRYAVGGEVPIDISKESTPEETLQKMQAVSKAALAPLSPSSADRRIASQAAAIAAQARREMQTEALTTSRQDDYSGERTSVFAVPGKKADDGIGTTNLDETFMPAPSADNGNRRQMVLKAYQRQAA